MKVIYKTSIIEKILDQVEEAKRNGKKIEYIEIDDTEYYELSATFVKLINMYDYSQIHRDLSIDSPGDKKGFMVYGVLCVKKQKTIA